jgi:hypothetical protein
MSKLQHVAPSANGAGHAPAAPCPPNCASCRGKSGWKTPCPTRIARFDTRHASAAYSHVRLLARTLEMVHQLADAYLERHPEGCECSGCACEDDETLANLRYDIHGIAWAALASKSYLQGVTSDCSAPGGETLAGAYLELADDAAALEAAERAEGLTLDDDQDADEPVAMVKPR